MNFYRRERNVHRAPGGPTCNYLTDRHARARWRLIFVLFTRQNMRKFNDLTPFRLYSLEYNSLVIRRTSHHVHTSHRHTTAVCSPRTAQDENHSRRLNKTLRRLCPCVSSCKSCELHRLVFDLDHVFPQIQC